MLMPRKTKHRKLHRGGPIRRVATRGINVNFGSYGLKAVTPGLVSARQIESARRAMTRYMERGGKVWIRIFPAHPMTKKGAEVPMGKGKGAVDHYVAKVKSGTVMFELDGVSETIARGAFERAGHKLCVKTKFVKKSGV